MPIVEPAANELTYIGEAQALVYGEGAWLYSLDGETYREEIPTAVNAGEYTVYFKATVADETKSITVTVAKADPHEQSHSVRPPCEGSRSPHRCGTEQDCHRQLHPRGAPPVRKGRTARSGFHEEDQRGNMTGIPLNEVYTS